MKGGRVARAREGRTRGGSRRAGEIRRVLGKARRLLDKLEAVLLDKSKGSPGRASAGKGRNRRSGKKKLCSRRGCGRPAKARGLCNAHYVAAFRKGKIKKYPKVAKGEKG